MSVKLKITLWYTIVIMILSGVVLTVITSIGEDMLERDISGRITRTVDDFSRRITAPPSRGGTPRLNFYEQGVHMAVYSGDHELTEGSIPFDLDEEPKFEDGALRTIEQDGDKYYVYTKALRGRGSDGYWLMGVVSVSDESYALRSAARTNVIFTLILIIIASAGGYFILRRALSPVKKITAAAREISEGSDLSKRIRIGAGTDEIHELANTFDAMLDKIEQTVEREKQFTSDASHELRTPVAVVLSECEYMTDCAKTPEEFRESAYSIKDQAERMAKLISELLIISRMDRNTIKTEFEEVDISELLTFVCDEQEEIQQSDITLIRQIPDGIRANADRFLLARLFINLISNAYSYGNPGGHVAVTLTETADTVTTAVEDDGIGINEEDLPKIWERFYQADPSRTSGGNMGLGLSMVKWIAACHGGEVTVESEPGRGSTFTFTMPKDAS